MTTADARRPIDRFHTLLARIGRRRVTRLRRAAAALLGGLALVLALAPPAAAAGTPVLVAAIDVTAGTTLQLADVAVRHWPPELVPAGALRDPTAARGRVLVGAARAGEPITDVRLVGAGPAAEGSSAAVPLRLADAGVAALLVPGSRVDVVTAGAGADRPVVLATDAAVLAVLADDAHGHGRLVMVALPREIATRVAAAALTEQIAFTLR